MSPVTQTAEVSVNRASIKDMPFFVENGNINNNVPDSMTKRKMKTIRTGGENFFLIKLRINS